MNRYRILLPLTISTANGSYTQGDEFEMDYTPDEEKDVLSWRGGGMLEIVPATYKVVGDQRVFETDPGDEFTAALTVGEQQHLIDTGHIERIPAEGAEPDTPPPAPRAKRKGKEEEV